MTDHKEQEYLNLRCSPLI